MKKSSNLFIFCFFYLCDGFIRSVITLTGVKVDSGVSTKIVFHFAIASSFFVIIEHVLLWRRWAVGIRSCVLKGGFVALYM